MSISVTSMAIISQLIFLLIVVLIVSFAVNVLNRLSEISHSLRSIDEKLGKSRLPECSSPHEENAE